MEESIKVRSSDIQLLGHCIFCLRKVNEKAEKVKAKFGVDDDVPKADVSPDFLQAFLRVWPLIQKQKNNGIGGANGQVTVDLDQVILITALKETQRSGGKLQVEEDELNITNNFKFSKLSPLCQLCADKIANVDNLLNTIKQQVRELKKISQESKNKDDDGPSSFRGRERKQSEEKLKASNLKGPSVEPRSAVGNLTGAVACSSSTSDIAQGETVTIKTEKDIGIPSYQEEKPSASTVAVKANLANCLEHSNASNNLEVSSNLEGNFNGGGGHDEDGWSDPDFFAESSDSDNANKKSSDQSDSDISPDSSSDSDYEEKPKKRKRSSTATAAHSTSSTRIRKDHFGNVITTTTKQTSGGTLKSKCLQPQICEFPGCGQTLCKVSSLRRHQRAKHPGYVPPPRVKKPRIINPKFPYECDMCGEKVLKIDFFEHVQEHVGDYALKCPYVSTCMFVASNPNSLRLHVPKSKNCLLASGEKNRERCKCETCGFHAHSVPSLKVHLEQQHEEGSGVSGKGGGAKLKCPISDCQQSFCTRQSVWFHLEAHSIKVASNQICVICGSGFPFDEMEEHLTMGHQVVEVLKCCRCAYLFFSHRQLLEHLLANHRNAAGGNSCQICENVKKVKYDDMDLRMHYKTVHQIDIDDNQQEFSSSPNVLHVPIPKIKQAYKRWQCDICNDESVSFCSNGYLKSHKIKVHGEEPFACKCGEKFILFDHFKRHEKAHLGIPCEKREFKCDVEGCNVVYKCRDKLRGHKQRVHEGVTKNICETCGKSFFDESALKRHRDIMHLGNFKFICDLCGKGFSEKTKLDNHKKRLDHRKYDKNQRWIA